MYIDKHYPFEMFIWMYPLTTFMWLFRLSNFKYPL